MYLLNGSPARKDKPLKAPLSIIFGHNAVRGGNH